MKTNKLHHLLVILTMILLLGSIACTVLAEDYTATTMRLLNYEGTLKNAGEHFDLVKDKHGLVVGAMDGLRYKPYELQLNPGAKLFVYTDGIAEATNSSNELYGAERLVKALQAHEDASPAELLHAVDADVAKFVGEAPQFDDMTMLCIEYNGR